MNPQEIRYFREISTNIWTSGQPTGEQLYFMKEFGMDAVINLALPDSDWAVVNESSIVTSLDIVYIQIPVNFRNPNIYEFELFSGIMDKFAHHKVLVHCAMNMRASVFVYLYRVKKQEVPIHEAKKDMYRIWRPDAVWQAFIDDVMENE